MKAMYVLGIDGGGTKTAVAVLDLNGNLISTSISGPSSIDTVSIEETKRNIKKAVKNIIGNKKSVFKSVFAGIGGITSSKQEKVVEDLIRQYDFIDNDTIIVAKNDVNNALAGGLVTRPGIAIIIGTGSVAVGVDEEENSWRCGGYGYKEGDSGSAYDLGIQSLRLLARNIDGRIKGNKFLDELKEKINVYDYVSLTTVINTYDRTRIAQL